VLLHVGSLAITDLPQLFHIIGAGVPAAQMTLHERTAAEQHDRQHANGALSPKQLSH
jgi:hypothetical protein